MSLGIPYFSQALPRARLPSFELLTSNFDYAWGRRHSNVSRVCLEKKGLNCPWSLVQYYLGTGRWYHAYTRERYLHTVTMAQVSTMPYQANFPDIEAFFSTVRNCGCYVCDLFVACHVMSRYPRCTLLALPFFPPFLSSSLEAPSSLMMNIVRGNINKPNLYNCIKFLDS